MWVLPLLTGGGASEHGPTLVAFAKQVVVATVKGEPMPKDEIDGMAKPVFVTIERGGKILGCRGTLRARTARLGDEIRTSAQSAAAHDPGYRPLEAKDLDGFLVTVTLVDRLEPMSGVAGLRPDDGLVLTAGGKQGIVLPWEGKDPQTRLRWAYQKAGVAIGSAARLERMIAERWRG